MKTASWISRALAALEAQIRRVVQQYTQLRQRHPLEVRTFSYFTRLIIILRVLGSPWLELALPSVFGMSQNSAWHGYVVTAIGQMASGTTVAWYGLLVALLFHWGQLPPSE